MSMTRGALPWILVGLAFPSAGFAQAAATAYPAEPELDPVLVVGEQPGPALWRVSFKDHELWILPTLAPLPRQLLWRSERVAELVSASQEVFTEASLDMHIGGSSKADAAVLKALQNPDGAWLRDILPPDLYGRFAAFNRRYAGNDARLELYRPFYASLELRKRALQWLLLDSDGDVHGQVGYLARKYEVPLRSLGRELNPRSRTLVANLRRAPVEADTACARWQLLQLERELRAAIERANAWSTGDIEALRSDWQATSQKDQEASCQALFQYLAPTDRAVRETRDIAFTALRKALRRNRCTVALVLLEEVFDPDGVVARFRAAGYQVEEPAGT
jgi:TraB/PrgY/gumN family